MNFISDITGFEQKVSIMGDKDGLIYNECLILNNMPSTFIKLQTMKRAKHIGSKVLIFLFISNQVERSN